MLDRSRSRDRSKTGGAFSPAGLFVTGAQGAWYDPSDFSTLFQNAAGTTPVTAVEQPVRLMLDRSRGLVLGAELITNGDFSNGNTGWNRNLPSWDATTGVMVNDGSNVLAANVNQSNVITAGKTYRIVFDFSRTSGSLNVWLAGSQLVQSGINTSGSKTFTVVASVNGSIFFEAVAGAILSIDNVSVRELPGNHALAPNDASRPVLGARYNLLERSEEFDNAYWTKLRSSISANAGVAPDGTTTADKLVEDTTATNSHDVRRSVTVINGASYTVSMYAKAAERTAFGIYAAFSTANAVTYFNLANGTIGTVAANATAAIQDAGNGWYRCSITVTANATTGNVFNYISSGTTTGTESYTGDGTSGILIWGAQLLTAADQTSTGGAYQRIAAATDYDTSNPVWRPYLAFDGSDDSLSTSAIDFSGTDEMTVFAGVHKASATVGYICELSSDAANTNGAFYLSANPSNDPRYGVALRGTAATFFAPQTFTAPVTNIVSVLYDIGGAAQADEIIPRINGAVNQTNPIGAANAGTGNFGNHPFFIGRQNNTSTPFNGRLYSLAVLGRTATAAELSAMEAWVAGKTGVNLP